MTNMTLSTFHHHHLRPNSLALPFNHTNCYKTSSLHVQDPTLAFTTLSVQQKPRYRWSLQHFGPDEAAKLGNVGNSNAVFEQYRQDIHFLGSLLPLAVGPRGPRRADAPLPARGLSAHTRRATPGEPVPHVLSVPQLVRLLSTAPSLARLILNGSNPRSPTPLIPRPCPQPAPALPHLTSVVPAPPPPQASRPLTPSPPVHTLALKDVSHPAATAPADAVPLLARVFAPVVHLELVSANPVALAIEVTKHAGAVDHAVTGVALQALVGAALAPGRLQLERGAGAVDPAATGAALQALETVCVCGSPRPFALGAGADVGVVDPAATGAMLQTLVGARGCAARCVEAAYAGAAHVHSGVPEQYMLGAMHVLVFRRAEGDGDGDRDTVVHMLHILSMYSRLIAVDQMRMLAIVVQRRDGCLRQLGNQSFFPPTSEYTLQGATNLWTNLKPGTIDR
ncbi:hypothetical protein B0H14DRAFT_3550874 [Mycena olivaceomarginata]|nr:hypothetical protein B0H14DRAFT_3550874 [Mycena olivaceomarginata]